MEIIRILPLLLFFILNSSGREFKLELNLDRCGRPPFFSSRTSACFVPAKCINSNSIYDPDETKLEFFPRKPKTTAGVTGYLRNHQSITSDCTAILQITSYTAKKYLIIIQVKATAGDYITDAGVSFVQGADGAADAVQFKCGKDSGGKVESGNSYFKIETLAPPRHEDRTVFCAFTIQSNKPSTADPNVMTDIAQIFEGNYHLPKITYKLMSGSFALNRAIVYESGGAHFWYKAHLRANCNPELISYKDEMDDTYNSYELSPMGSHSLKCESTQNLRFTFADDSDQVLVKSDPKILCDEGDWSYKTDTEAEMKIKSAIFAQCIEKFCSLCERLKRDTCPSCDRFTAAKDPESGCQIATCPNNQWLLDGKAFDGEVECRKDSGARSASWYAKGGTDKVQKATCLKEKDSCWVSSDIVDICPNATLISEDMECVESKLMKSKNKSVLLCSDGAEMRYLSAGVLQEAANITCDFKSIKFKDGTNEIAKGTNVFCLAKKVTSAANVVGPIVGGSIVGLLALCCIIGAVVWFLKRRKTQQASTTKKAGLISDKKSLKDGTGRDIIGSSVKQSTPAETPVSPDAATPRNTAAAGTPKTGTPRDASTPKDRTDLVDPAKPRPYLAYGPGIIAQQAL